MDDIRHPRGPIVDSLRRHVLTPLSDAQSLVQQEHEEVEAERQAFQRFKERVGGLQTVSPRTAAPTRHTVALEPSSRKTDRLRNAYRETVMGVPHYDDVYGEPLDTHAVAELSAEVATGLQRDATPFTDVYKTQLTAAISRAVTQREAFCESLQTEQDSLVSAQEALTDLLDPLDGPRVPAWHTADFDDDLTDLAETRQETVRSRTQPAHVDGHDLCAYLYDDPEWTYPVLTAVARLRGAVEYRTEQNHSATHVGVHE